jgi:2-oxoisovalerate dehydrogenase E2 component (dihydrolipoyl transacylase)
VAKVTMPQLGESVAEGTIGKWLKKPGDRVERDEPLLEIITDKVNAEVPSPFAGIVSKLLVEEGATVPYKAEIAEIEETAEAAAPAQAAAATPAPATVPATALATAPATAGVAVAPPVAAPTPATPPAVAAAEAGSPEARMTPAVRQLMRQHGLDPAQVAGTGHGGRITREDVMRVAGRASGAVMATQPGATTAAEEAAVAPSVPLVEAIPPASHAPGLAPSAPSPAPVVWAPGQDEELVPFTQMRAGIAAQMARASTVPVAYSTFEADMTGVVNVRAALAESYRAREGAGLSFLPFVVKAVVEALHGSPDLNAHYTAVGLLRKRHIDIGIAIAVDNGLIVPVIHDADQLSINGLNHAIGDLAARARAGRLRLDDLQGGTFTVDNTGWFGSVLTVPIINPPQVCILTTEAVVKRPVVHETAQGDVIAIRSMMNLVAGYDHRATDGAQVGRFVRDVICWLEATGPDTPVY